jgi:uncharacterized protein (TIGR03790 family)
MSKAWPCLLFLALAVNAPEAAALGPQNVLVLANRDCPRSLEIAAYYARARAIPAANILLLSGPDTRTMDFGPFQDAVAEPLRKHLAARHGAPIDCLVLADGIPLRVRLPQGPISASALLAVLDTPLFGRPQTSLPTVANPYLDSDTPFSHRKAFGDLHLYLVTHLCGLTAVDAKALVDRSLASDRSAPVGDFYFQKAKGNARGRNATYDKALKDLKERGLRAFVLPWGPAALAEKKGIAGLLTGGKYSGLAQKTVDSLSFRPGALVDLLESYGAVPRNFDPGRNPVQVPVTWFIRAGATGVHGTVAEPYAHAFPRATLFRWYSRGYGLAEAYFMSLPFLYWQNAVFGDPLAAPYAARPAVTVSVTEDAGLWVKVEAKPTNPRVGVQRVALFGNGRPLGAIEGCSGTFKIAPPTGELVLLATATGWGRAQPTGWAVRTIGKK